MKENNTFFAKDFFEFENSINTDFQRNEIHYHNSYEIYYLTEGICRYFIDKKSYHLSSGDIALIPKGVIHKTNYGTKYHSRLLINCSESFIPDSVKGIFSKTPYLPETDETKVQVKAIFEVIQREYNSPDEFSEDVIRSKISELLVLIARCNEAGVQKNIESPIIERAVKYIHKNYARGVTLKGAAEHCYVSPEHLSRTFKRETGFGFNEYLTVYRLKRANSILNDDPKAKISDVALKCGFNDSNYFSKVYKKVYKQSPANTKGKMNNRGEKSLP